MAVFLDVYNTLPGCGSPSSAFKKPTSPRRSQATFVNSKLVAPSTQAESKQASLTSFKDVLLQGNKVDNNSASQPFSGSKSSPSTVISHQTSPRRFQSDNVQDRPSTPAMHRIDSKSLAQSSIKPKSSSQQNGYTPVDDFADFTNFDATPKNPITVEVKPLPKIRLDLCPVPREEDEEEDSSVDMDDGKQKKKSKHKHRRQNH